ncbi:MAG: hypothetical protein ACI8RD_005218, partial [Bacillariaceae sp.]
KKARVKSRAKTANEDNSFFDFPRAELYIYIYIYIGGFHQIIIIGH